MSGEAMSVKEAAQELNCSTVWITRLINRGEIRARRLDGRTWLIDRAAFAAYKERKESEVKQKP